MTNHKEYTEAELDKKLDSLMNEDDSWVGDCFGNLEQLWEEQDEVRKEAAIEAARYQPCGKCNGKGKIDHYHYVSNGVCFACDGTGKIYK
jgi:RecJ-like exonuclease|tara:strand:- start:157 stop:426 length:270 start_codon:yes stop_codon:yes gene_type:complete